MPLTRRDFARLSLSSLGTAFLGGCAASPGSPRSYLTDLVPLDREIPVDAFWTDVMFQGVRDQAIGPPLAARIYAIGHLAGFLAVNAIDGKYHCPYSEIGRAPQGISAKAAYAAAVSQASAEGLQTSMDIDLQRSLKRIETPGGDVDAGVKWGLHVGRIVQKKRTIDGGHAEKVGFYFDPEYTPRKTIDSWSSTGPFYKAEVGPRFQTYERGSFANLGNMTPFGIRSKTQFSADPFPDVRSKEFADQFEEVYTYGGTHSTVRTQDQYEIAFFWEDGPRGGTVPAAFIHIALRILQQQGRHSLVERAHLLAQLSCAMADAGLSAWHSKYYYDIIRPETAILHSADKFGNPDPRVKCDPKWTSLIFTPSFPAYVSGHSTFSGAGAEVLKQWFGTDRVTFEVAALDIVNWPKQLKGVKRRYHDFTTVADENGMSRIYGGVHWQHDNVQGLRMGRSIGDFICKNYLHRIG